MRLPDVPIETERLVLRPWEDDDMPVGSTGLHDRKGPGGLEIGYWIHVDHVRKGFASEAVAALADAALTLADIERVYICHDAENHASAGVPASVGFVRRADRSAPVKAPSETGTQWVWELRRPG
ncbi:MAG: GNAT family N-acetyltransferase [Acidimicrobiales bacterium]|nr:GNAT family N-acetyltransferase [Acidimicrobiales bacterium]